MKLWVFILRRVLLMVPVLIGVMTITFALVSTIPLSERLLAAGPAPRGGWNSDPAAKEAAIHRLGLDQPVPVQYGIYLADTFTGQWGYVSPDSAMTKEVSQIQQAGPNPPVMLFISNWLPYTMELSALSLILVLLFSIPLGNYSAVWGASSSWPSTSGSWDRGVPWGVRERPTCRSTAAGTL
jgi:ABC-type dipeptide/oligopeptide/nickel transport system permease component